MGKNEQTTEDRVDEFVEQLHKAIAECMMTGNAAKIYVSSSDPGKPVTIEIYREKGDMAKLSGIIEEAAKNAQITVSHQGVTQ